MTGRTIELFLDDPRPRTKGNSEKIHKRGARRWVGPSDATKRAQESLVLTALSHPRPSPPLAGAVELEMVVCLPIPKRSKAWTKERRAAAESGELAPISKAKGDRGNYAKMLEDVLEAAGFLEDDAQVVDGPVGKVYSTRPGWLVRLRELGATELRARAAEIARRVAIIRECPRPGRRSS